MQMLFLPRGIVVIRAHAHITILPRQGRIQDLRKGGAYAQLLKVFTAREFFSRPRLLIAHARFPRGYYC